MRAIYVYLLKIRCCANENYSDNKYIRAQSSLTCERCTVWWGTGRTGLPWLNFPCCPAAATTGWCPSHWGQWPSDSRCHLTWQASRPLKKKIIARTFINIILIQRCHIINPYGKGKLTRVVVHAAAVHEWLDVLHRFLAENPLPGQRTHSSVGQGGSNDAVTLTSHLKGA